MNRRSFISGILASCVAPTLLLGANVPKWKRTKELWIPNPNWKTATYEICYFHTFDIRSVGHFISPEAEKAALKYIILK